MTRKEAEAILDRGREETIRALLVLAEKAGKFDQLMGPPDPTTPSGGTPTYLKKNHRGRKKKPGRKTGHPSASRKTPPDVTDYRPHTLTNCPDCGNSLKAPIRHYKRIIEDIPAASPQVTEHTIHGYWCGQCRKIVTPKVADALPHSNLGLRLVVYTAWLHYTVGVSVNNLVRVLSAFSGFTVSAGGLTQAWARLADLLKPEYDALGREVKTSAVLHTDETGWRLSGRTHWLWCFATKTVCYYLITPGRGSPVVKKVLGALFRGILITDFYGAYNKIAALAKQKCFYHLFAELVKVDKRNNSLAWHMFRKQLSRLLKDAIRLSDKREAITAEAFGHAKLRLNARLDRLCAAIKVDDPDAQRLRKRLVRHRNELFTFLDNPSVSPYNNHAERMIRPAVISRKISQQNRSKRGAETQAILMSLFQTAKLQNQNPIEVVMELARQTMLGEKTKNNLLRKAA
jgi:transposase